MAVQAQLMKKQQLQDELMGAMATHLSSQVYSLRNGGTGHQPPTSYFTNAMVAEVLERSAHALSTAFARAITEVFHRGE